MSETDAQEDQYADTPKGWASRWTLEFEAAKKEVKPWHDQGKKVVDRYLDKNSAQKGGRRKERRLNLFTSNTQTLQAVTYGKTPQVSVTRRFDDAKDDVARVAAEMMERLANSDIEKDSDSYSVAMNHALEDRLIPGMGNVRCRYVAEFEETPETPAMMGPDGVELAPMVPATTTKTYECVEVDYVPWRDQLWSPARVFSEVRWWSFLAEMSRPELVAKFGKEAGARIPLNAKKAKGNKTDDAKQADPWARANVWEIWDKESRCTWFFVEGYAEVLVPVGVQANPNGSIPDPLGLDGFWPFPLPLVANTTTSAFVPQSDFYVGQDLYNEIDDYSTRIYLMQKALRVAGVYDKSNEAIQRLISEATDNELIPVDNWAMLGEKGGIKGAVDWLPLEQIIGTLDKLRELRTESIQLLFQVTGMSDIMRGQATTTATATEQSIKAKFASVRVQRIQDDFAKCCTGTQKIKLEIISKHFDPETIIRLSNVERTQDAQHAQAAVALIKSNFYDYRVEVKPESVSLTDYAAMQSERTNFVQGLSQFLMAMEPAAAVLPAPQMLQLLQWYLAGFKGSSTIQGVIDQAIAQAEEKQKQAEMNPPPPPPPDPKVVAQQMKGQQEQQYQQAQLQGDLIKLDAETKAAVSQRRAEASIDVQEESAKARINGAMEAALNPLGVR